MVGSAAPWPFLASQCSAGSRGRDARGRGHWRHDSVTEGSRSTAVPARPCKFLSLASLPTCRGSLNTETNGRLVTVLPFMFIPQKYLR